MLDVDVVEKLKKKGEKNKIKTQPSQGLQQLFVSITWPSTIKLPKSLRGFPLHTRQRTVLEKKKGQKGNCELFSASKLREERTASRT